MSRRAAATIVVSCLLLVLAGVALVLPVPYVAMSPGPAVNVLGDMGDKGSTPIIAVSGHRTYDTSGQLRLTTVSVTGPTRELRLPDVMTAWFDPHRAVYPRDAIYPPDQTTQDVEQQSSVEMVNSQDTAIAAALTELGYHLTKQVEVLAVTKGSPAQGKLKVHDHILRVDGARITDVTEVTKAVQKAGIGHPVTFVVRRGGQTKRVRATPKAAPDDPSKPRVGVQIGVGYDFPFDVSVRLGGDIGGPSAGLMFSLGVYDTLTPGALTGGADVAGTGTIDERGHVGPIGGIQQKIAGAADKGATLFLVPPANCNEAEHADVDKDRIRLVKAPTIHRAITSLRAYAHDKDADLPGCG
jgi:PDZ domain-containing protein